MPTLLLLLLPSAIASMKGMCCRKDGAVLNNVMKTPTPIPGTAPCSWKAVENECATKQCPALSLLSSISNGQLTRFEVELVIATAQANGEDLSWSAPFERIRSVYTHPAHFAGREAYAYLKHINERWDSLADRTVFMHGRQPTCGYFMRDGSVGNHLQLNT